MRRSQDLPGIASRRTERIVVTTALLSLMTALVLTLRFVQLGIHPHLHPASSLQQVFDQYLVATRVIAGVAIVLGWPLALHLSARLMGLTFPRPSYFLTLLGILVGGIAYSTSFLPWPVLAAAPLIPAVVSLVLIPWVLQITWKRGVLLWLLQGSFVVALFITSFWGLESAASGRVLNPLKEIPIIYQYAQLDPVETQELWPNPSRSALPTFSWPASGSAWLDHRANRVQITVLNQERADNWTVSLVVNGVEVHDHLSEYDDNAWHSPHFIPQPDAVYRIVTRPETHVGDNVVVRGLLPLQRTDNQTSL